MELCAEGFRDYAVIDCGGGLRLERLGEVVISRQAAQAFWAAAMPPEEWQRLCWASHFRHDQGPGAWTYARRVPDAWPVALGEMRMEARLTQFGHVGAFAEQQVQWPWIRERAGQPGGARVLNLFAYTGGSTLAAALGGAEVTHVDAVKGVVNWARRTAELSGLDGRPIRWIVDDALKFARREARRGRRYDLVVLDPPTFGRGPQGTVWKIEEQLPELLDACVELLADGPAAMLLSAHTPGVTAAVLRNLLRGCVMRRGGKLTSGEMVQRVQEGGVVLPAGYYCRWES